jgi:hypothetical protein
MKQDKMLSNNIYSRRRQIILKFNYISTGRLLSFKASRRAKENCFERFFFAEILNSRLFPFSEQFSLSLPLFSTLFAYLSDEPCELEIRDKKEEN